MDNGLGNGQWVRTRNDQSARAFAKELEQRRQHVPQRTRNQKIALAGFTVVVLLVLVAYWALG
ncbi:hypothetical protein [Actinomadura sediminis]|uniref:Uncharacterized protein n=1 Tax=Actinomadura sediminis TaxID=1038904 RepID=A0ABW3EYC8_9ACTN